MFYKRIISRVLHPHIISYWYGKFYFYGKLIALIYKGVTEFLLMASFFMTLMSKAVFLLVFY